MTPSSAAEETGVTDTNRRLVRRCFDDMWNRRDLGVCDEIMAEDFEEHAAAPFAPSAPGRVHGPSAARGTVEWLVAQFPDIRMTIESIVSEGDTVAVRVLAEGTNLGALNGVIPPTGRRFSARQSHWFRIRDGLLAEHWATREDLPAMVQLGVIQAPGAAPPDSARP